ncbi:MAG TPA: peptide ABC transporter substrate-binding protein [Candidatus Baltobacteraceae bacterium]|nr:peptide ABC transporter substrate-binding protein [Candidatus Baltobacteraceae bacterium]
MRDRIDARARTAAVVWLLLTLAACHAGGYGRGEAHVLRIADNVDPSSLNPLLAHDQDTIGYDLLVTQTLVGLSAANRLEPVLVTAVPSRANGGISPDGRTIVYHLRRNVRFADGMPLTSADVAFTYRAIVDPRNPVESQDAYRRIAWLRTPDSRTVVIRLKKRWNAAVSELFAQADFAFGILPAHAFASTDVTRSPWNQHPFGTGPFRVVQWRRDDRIVLEPNPYYRPRPKLRRIVFALIPTTQASLIALRSGEVDVAEINPAELPDARGIAGVKVVVTPVNGEYMLTLQTAAPPTDDVAVRAAISDAIDRTEVARRGFGALTPADSFLPPVLPWHDSAPDSTHAHLARLATELRADGWQRVGGWWTKDGHRLSVTIDLEPLRGQWMQVVEQEQLRRAGIEARLKTFATTQFNAPGGPLRSGRFTVAANQWIGAADPEQSVIFACSQRGSDGNNNSNYCSPRFDALFADQATTDSQARRRSDFIEMQRLIRRDVPIVPIAFQSNVDAISDRVTGFARNMLMYPVDAASWDTVTAPRATE